MKNFKSNPGVFADPTVDTAFKRIFGTERFKEATIGLISDITGKKVKHLEFRNVELVPELSDIKKSIVDVLCQDEEGNWFTVEMQRAKQANFLKRIVFYASRVISNNTLARGVKDYDIPESYLISFVKFPIKDIIYPEMLSHPYAHHFVTADAGAGSRVKLPGSPEYYIFDLSAFDKKPEEIDNILDYWLYLLSESQNMEDVPEIADGNRSIETFFEAANFATFSSEELNKYYEDMMNEWDYANSIEYAKKEGKAEGLAEGRAEVARAMKAAGVAKEIIAQCSGLSLEEVEALN